MAEARIMDWRLVFLERNPFRTTPPRRMERLVWAGFPDLRGQFQRLFDEAINSSRTQVVLNSGEYGSGKTHAAFYFGRSEHLPHGRRERATSLYIRTPKEPERSAQLLYRDIIEDVGFRRLGSVVRDGISIYGREAMADRLVEVAGNETFGRALMLAGLEEETQTQANFLPGDAAFDDSRRLIESYFFSATSRTDLRKLGLSRGIDSIHDRFLVLAAILQSLIGFAPTDDVTEHNRVILWIDELEDLLTYPTRSHRPFTQGLRDLIDRLPDNFTLLMNITLASPEVLEDIGTVLGAALLDRVTHHIQFREPSEQQALEYIRDLLSQHRTEDWEASRLPDLYPFDKEALRTLIGTLPRRTPRDINQRCADIIGRALRERVITDRGEGAIDTSFVQVAERERIELEMR